MIFFIHKNSTIPVKAIRNGKNIDISSKSCTEPLWELAKNFPDEFLIWVEEEFQNDLLPENLKRIFYHDRIMASYSLKTQYLSDDIGYIDQLPFINVARDVKYPTWQMSTDIGGIHSSVLLKFQSQLAEIPGLGYLLNSVAKTGQQNGLFCYSDPGLIELKVQNKLGVKANNRDLFAFVSQHYKVIWSFVLLYCFIRYEKNFPLFAFINSFFKADFFKMEVDLSETKIENADNSQVDSIDIIIPTIGRPQFLHQVVKDLSEQSLLPKRVIIIEQNPDTESTSEISDLINAEWPFEIIHHFTHKTGACMARNMALKEVNSEWVFFADDDIRVPGKVLEQTIREAKRLGVDCINLNCKQPGEATVFKKIKQWGSFGSGTSVVRSKFASLHRFSEVYEHGYGEDSDYGMKLRQSGCDIIYHPDLVIQHLKAPIGGFRKKPTLEWEMEKPLPKPSPTIMIFSKRYFTKKQIKGYRISLLLKSYKNQPIRNPLSYLRSMRKRWELSEFWSRKLMARNPE